MTGREDCSTDGFPPEDYAYIAQLLRTNLQDDASFKAILSNNYSIILAALDVASEANADLIAAAPDMFEALKWAEGALGPFSQSPAEKSGMALIRAALAKASGAL